MHWKYQVSQLNLIKMGNWSPSSMLAEAVIGWVVSCSPYSALFNVGGGLYCVVEVGRRRVCEG
jgi:hypothetical protein